MPLPYDQAKADTDWANAKYGPQTQTGTNQSAPVDYATKLRNQAETYTPPAGTEAAYNPALSKLGNQFRSQYEGKANTVAQRQAQQMTPAQAQAARMGYSQAGSTDQRLAMEQRAAQNALANAFQRRAMGTAPSAAEMQLRQQSDQNLRNQMAMANSMRGGNVGAQQRQIAEMGFQNQQATNNQAAVLRAQEQAQAQDAYGNMLSGVRNQDIDQAKMAQDLAIQNADFSQQAGLNNAQFQQDVALQNAKLQQDASSTNAELALKQQALNDAMVQQYLNMGFNYEQAEREAKMQAARLQSEVALGQMSENSKTGAAAMNMAATGLATVGTLAASDSRLKTEITPGDKDAEAVLGSMTNFVYKYREEKYGKGKRLGPMAQDLEKTEAGKNLVIEKDGSKMVDVGGAALMALGLTAHVNKKLKSMEKEIRAMGHKQKTDKLVKEAEKDSPLAKAFRRRRGA